jgi:fimbrial isopeptide formation D2 family protein/LPXTG-motif cell wall-anchored protein
MLKKSKKSMMTMLLALVMTVSLGSQVLPAKADTPDLPDPAHKGKITVHKISRVSPSVTPGDGLEITDPTSLGTPLEGAEFDLLKINEGTYTVDKDSTPAAVPTTSLTSMGTKTTPLNGIVDWDNLDLGYYILREVTTPAGHSPVADSIIQVPMGITEDGTGWNYDIHVYPKDISASKYTKEVMNEEPAYNVTDTANWKIQGLIDQDLYATAPNTSYKITDALDERLTFQSAVVTVAGGTGGVLTLNSTHYTENYVTATNTVTWELTAAGKAYVIEKGSTEIVVNIATKLNEKATSTGDNNGSTIFNSAKFEIGSLIEVPAVTPEIIVAGVTIKKVDSQDHSVLVDGAKFKIATSKANAQAGHYIKKDNAATGADLEVTTGDDPNTTATEHGWAMFAGLPLNSSADTKFYIVEIEAPANYVKRQSIIEVTVLNGSKTAIVEVENQKIGAPPIDEEKPSFKLPLTGGTGTILFTVVGVALVATAMFLLFGKRKKTND